MIEIILRTENFLVINKPAGMFVHDSNWSRMHKLGSDEPPVDCVLTALRKQLKEEFYEKTEDKEKKFKVNLHSVHRLDRMTSGCLIVALSAKWVSILQKSLQRAQKTYLTLLTKGSFDYSCLEDIETTNINILNDKDRINNNYNNNDNIIDKEIQPMFQPLSDKSSFILSYPLNVSKKRRKPQNAESLYHVLSESPQTIEEVHFQKLQSTTNEILIKKVETNSSLALVQPRTGRHHQIRKHSQILGHPIAGDNEHGNRYLFRYWREKKNCPRLMLHCLSLYFAVPKIEHLLENPSNPLPDLSSLSLDENSQSKEESKEEGEGEEKEVDVDLLNFEQMEKVEYQIFSEIPNDMKNQITSEGWFEEYRDRLSSIFSPSFSDANRIIFPHIKPKYVYRASSNYRKNNNKNNNDNNNNNNNNNDNIVSLSNNNIEGSDNHEEQAPSNNNENTGNNEKKE